MRKRAAGGLSAGPESSDEELGSLLMRTGSVMWVFVGEAGRDGVGELYQAPGSAIAGSMLGPLVAQIAMSMSVNAECVRNNARDLIVR